MVQEAIPQVQTTEWVEEEEVYVASQWRLMWWRFKKHKPAIIAGFILGFFYLLFPLSEFMGVGDPAENSQTYHYLRPQPLRFFDDDGFNPHMNALRGFRDANFKKDYEILDDVRIPVGFFVKGFEYDFLGFIETDRHLLGFKDIETLVDRPSLFLLGSDKLGRDQWSRLLLSTRISLSIGLIGVALSLVGGIILGGISGFYGGVADTIIQRIIEIMGAVPSLPLWMGLSSAVPQDWSVLQVYFGITVILSIFGWTGMARVVRGKFLALREEGLCDGCPDSRVFRGQDNVPSHAALVLQPHHRLHQPGHSRHDSRRDLPQLPGPRAPAAGGQLRNHAPAGTESADSGAVSVADVRRDSRHHRYPLFQLPR